MTPHHHKLPHHQNRRGGQVAVFLLVAFVVLAFMVLWSVDLRRIVFLKGKSQDAGDAAALSAARWQGTSLNLIGEINLLRMLAISANDPATEDALTNMQARLCFTGPMAAFAAAQQGAKQNGIYVHPDYTTIVRDHADTVRNTYTTTSAGQMLFDEPYPEAWTDYANMLDLLAADGIAAGADNAELYTDTDRAHILLNRDFYEAVAGRNWCWFFFNHPTLLAAYTDHSFWPPLPEPEWAPPFNAEFFSLFVMPVPFVLENLVPETITAAAVVEAGLNPSLITTQATEQVHSWYVYQSNRWQEWTIMDPEGEESFPITGPVRPQYNYIGADAVVRVETAASRMTPGLDGSSRHDTILWTAAAKAFGYLNEGNDTTRPDIWSLVIPAYRDVRLIPIDAASGGGNGAFDLMWMHHIREHLPLYVAYGTREANCWYCNQLGTWEVASFRQEGIDWLDENSSRCRRPSTGGGGSRGGGTRRGH